MTKHTPQMQGQSDKEVPTTFSRCPECGGVLVWDHQADEKVCQKCGLVLPLDTMDRSLPFDTTYALTSGIAHEKSLGDTLRDGRGRDLTFKVLAKSPKGRADLPIRAIHIRTLTKTDSPLIRSSLRHASDVLRKVFNEADNHLVANDVGNLIRKTGHTTLVELREIKPLDLALACLTYVFEKYGFVVKVGDEIVEARCYFKPKDEVLRFVRRIGQTGGNRVRRP